MKSWQPEPLSSLRFVYSVKTLGITMTTIIPMIIMITMINYDNNDNHDNHDNMIVRTTILNSLSWDCWKTTIM